MGNPFSGYIMVLKVVGRKSGKLRYAPVNYAIYQGSVWCISGGRKTSDWYKNLLANPAIEMIMPGGAIYGQVSEENDPETRRIVIRRVLKNAGFAGFFEGYNPWKISDEEMHSKIGNIPLLKITPTGIGNGASDPSGLAWISVLVLAILLIVLLIILL
ncbi:MAG: nitroreductase family deazaflavin-dependent oxidoreductase [Anaerolineaceae bacterium]|nr:nitroreductase family deazaflavin-dependent oxidoreductase [Anaerolineaceae bacterium]